MNAAIEAATCVQTTQEPNHKLFDTVEVGAYMRDANGLLIGAKPLAEPEPITEVAPASDQIFACEYQPEGCQHRESFAAVTAHEHTCAYAPAAPLARTARAPLAQGAIASKGPTSQPTPALSLLSGAAAAEAGGGSGQPGVPLAMVMAQQRREIEQLRQSLVHMQAMTEVLAKGKDLAGANCCLQDESMEVQTAERSESVV